MATQSAITTVTSLELRDWEYKNCFCGLRLIASSNFSLLIDVPAFSVNFTDSLLIFLSLLFLDLLFSPVFEIQHHTKSAFARLKFSG
jgi:hypothetical protein